MTLLDTLPGWEPEKPPQRQTPRVPAVQCRVCGALVPTLGGLIGHVRQAHRMGVS